MNSISSKAAASLCLAMAAAGAQAAEGFEPRYNLAGSLGGEIFAPPEQRGWAIGAAATYVPVRRVSGDDGKDLRLAVPGASVAVPGLPGALAPAFPATEASVRGTGAMHRTDLALAWLSDQQDGGGQLIVVLDVPVIRKEQHISLSAPTPALAWPNPAVPDPVTRGAVAGQFGSQYQQGLAGQGAAATGNITGLGDAELMAGWQKVGERLRLLAGASLVLPTGKYGADPQPDAGTGNFYTVRPAVQAAYLPSSRLALGAKLSLGLNSRNRDNQLRSGNWWGTELAAGYMTPVGVVGLHMLRVQQYQADDQNPLGPSRFRSTNGGVFFTTKLPGADTIVTLQSIATLSSRQAKHGSFTQLRLIKSL